MDEMQVARTLLRHSDEKPPATTYRHAWTPYLLYCIMSAVVAAFLFGYNGVVINEPYQILENFINSSYGAHRNSTVYLNEDNLDTLWTLTVSLFLVGGIFGSFLGGPQANRFGRKKSLMFNCLIGIVGGGLMFAAPFLNIFEMLMAGRVVTGFHCGLISGIVPVFIMELAPLSLRGASGTINHFSICCGCLSSCIVGLPALLSRADSPFVWPFLFFPSILLPILQIVMLLFTVESPRWLMLMKQDEAAAIFALQKLRGKDTPREVIAEEIADLKRDAETSAALPKIPLCAQLRGALSWPLLVCVMMQITQHLSGINAAVFYSSKIFEKIGLKGDVPQYATMGIIATTVVMALVSAMVVERLGRRSLMIFGIAGMWLSCILVTIFMVLSTYYENDVTNYMTIVVLIFYVAAFGIGPGPIPWFIAPELSLPQYRPIFISICTLVNWCANLTIAFGFPPLQKALGPYAFVAFFGTLTVFFIFAVLFLPETRGKTPEESIRRLGIRRIQLDCLNLSKPSTTDPKAMDL